MSHTVMSFRRVLSCSRWDLEEGHPKTMVASLLLVAARNGFRKVGRGWTLKEVVVFG